MSDARALRNALTVIRSIEETIASHEESLDCFYFGEYALTISDCDLPDHIIDPFELIRFTLGNEYADRIEYEGDLRLIANVLESCLEAELKRQGRSVFDLEAEEESDSDDDDRTADDASVVTI